MTDGSRIHVFVGAPTIALIPPQGICGNTVCDEGGHFYEEHRVHLQCSSPWEHTLCRSGQSLSDPSCYVAGDAAAGQPPSLTGSGDTWPPHEVCASSPQNVCEHVTAKQRPKASLHCDLELSVSENHQGGSKCDVSHGNYSTSTDAEFLAVLASSQVPVQVHNSKTCQMREIEKFPFPSFTGLNIDPIENASCKRKTTSMDTLYLTTSSDQISKKPKHTGSLIQHVSKESDNQRPQPAPTLLKNCCDKNKEYNILAVVLQPCHVKEIQAKSRPNSGSFPLATIVVLDQSGVKCKILMWRTAAFWSLALLPGDIIMLKKLTVCKDKWSKETFLQSTFNSSFFNLGNCSLLTTDQYKNVVEYLALQELLCYISTEHCYLQDLPSRPPQQLDCTQHARLSKLHPEVLVHSILKVVSISILKECTYNFYGLEQNKVILTVEEAKGQIGTLILWGKSVSWCEQIRMKRDCIWVFKYLFCKKSLISGDVELHTTPWSSCECLFDDDKRALDFQKRYENVSSPKLLSLRTVLEGKYSGNFQIKVSISEFKFHVPGNQNICVNKQTSITKILSSLPSVIYSGCGNCRKELRIDCNNVYEQCSFCLSFAQIRLFYRPVLMTVRNEGDELFVHVPSDVLEKIFLNISPNLLHKLVFESSNVTHGAIVADTCHSLLADNSESYLLSIKSHFSLDENSVPLEQEFHVLSFLVNI